MAHHMSQCQASLILYKQSESSETRQRVKEDDIHTSTCHNSMFKQSNSKEARQIGKVIERHS